jgi:hypothetical protein
MDKTMKFWAKMKMPALVALALVLASYVVFLEVQASSAPDALTGSSAVWQPAQNQLSAIQYACQSRGEAYSECFLKLMASFGASEEAVSFTRNYSDQNHGAVAFLNGFRPAQVVDLGYAFFPSGAYFNQRWLLLNGAPDIIDVDNLSLLPQDQMAKDPDYAALRRRYPRVALFDGDRSLDRMPSAETLPDDGQSFAVEYPLKDRCRACAVVGQATFAFNFDADGRLRNVSFLKAAAARPEIQKTTKKTN